MPLETPLIEWARQFQSPNHDAIDIGANVGDWTVDMARHSHHVHAFEPSRSTYRVLKANCADLDNVTTYEWACGGHSSAMVPLYSHDQDPGKSSLMQTPFHDTMHYESCSVRPLDDLLLTNVGFLKIDVEGSEEQVLWGSIETLERSGWPKIIMECWSYPWFALRKHNLMKFVEDIGYTPVPVQWPDMFLLERRP
jgi:FkbM family methyltransferase